jgi:hypothetical protein
MGVRVVLAASAAALALTAPAAAQDSPPWTLEGAAGAPHWLTLSGSFRTRYETLDGQFRPGLSGSDQLVSLRSTLFAEARLDHFRIGGEILDSRAYGGDAGGAVGTGEVNALELTQAYVGYRFDDAFADGAHADLQLGRFTMDLGSRRLVGRNNFRNTTNAFTGARFDWTSAAHTQLTLFYTLPHTRLPAGKPSILDNDIAWDDETDDLTFWGVFFAARNLPLGARGEAFVFGLDEADSAGTPTRNRHLITPGFRLYRDPAPGRFDFEIEAGVQTGEARGSSNPADVTELDVDASYAHVEFGYRWDAFWAPRLAFEYDYASGDASSTDNAYGRFDGLYGPRRPDFGPTGIYGPLGRSNISSPGLRLEVNPDDRWDGFIFYRVLYLDEARDSFANTGIRDASGASGDFAGHQIEARARYWITPRALRLDLGAAALLQDEFLERAPNATGEGDTLYGYADITWTF